MVLEEVLEARDLSADLSEKPWLEGLRAPTTGELRDGNNYYGEFFDGLYVTVTTPWWSPDDEHPSERACLQLVEVLPAEDDGQSTRGYGACGSLRLGFATDVIVGDGTSEAFDDLAVPGYAAGTVLRFEYDDASETIEVWSLPPEEGPDPDA